MINNRFNILLKKNHAQSKTYSFKRFSIQTRNSKLLHYVHNTTKFIQHNHHRLL
jgi:hypothetical protein